MILGHLPTPITKGRLNPWSYLHTGAGLEQNFGRSIPAMGYKWDDFPYEISAEHRKHLRLYVYILPL